MTSQAISTLKPNQEQAALMLAAGRTAVDTASALECTPETISRWKRQPAFQARLNGLRLDALEATRNALRNAGTEAVQELTRLIQEATSEETRRRSCKDILDAIAGTAGNSWSAGIGSDNPHDIVMREAAEKELADMFALTEIGAK